MEKIKLERFHLIGIAVRTTNENNKAATDIALLWQKFWQEDVLTRIPNRTDNNSIYSLYTNYESDHTSPYTTIIGCKVESLDSIPEGMVGQSFDGGNYIKTVVRGDLNKGLIVSQWSEIWSMDLNRTFTADFEEFGEKALNPSDAEINFFVAVK